MMNDLKLGKEETASTTVPDNGPRPSACLCGMKASPPIAGKRRCCAENSRGSARDDAPQRGGRPRPFGTDLYEASMR